MTMLTYNGPQISYKFLTCIPARNTEILFKNDRGAPRTELYGNNYWATTFHTKRIRKILH